MLRVETRAELRPIVFDVSRLSIPNRQRGFGVKDQDL